MAEISKQNAARDVFERSSKSLFQFLISHDDGVINDEELLLLQDLTGPIILISRIILKLVLTSIIWKNSFKLKCYHPLMMKRLNPRNVNIFFLYFKSASDYFRPHNLEHINKRYTVNNF